MTVVCDDDDIDIHEEVVDGHSHSSSDVDTKCRRKYNVTWVLFIEYEIWRLRVICVSRLLKRVDYFYTIVVKDWRLSNISTRFASWRRSRNRSEPLCWTSFRVEENERDSLRRSISRIRSIDSEWYGRHRQDATDYCLCSTPTWLVRFNLLTECRIRSCSQKEYVIDDRTSLGGDEIRETRRWTDHSLCSSMIVGDDQSSMTVDLRQLWWLRYFDIR